MTALAGKKQNLNLAKNNIEERLDARAVSRGFAIGKVVCLHGRKRQFYRIEINDLQIEREIRRFRAAVQLATRQLKKSARKKRRNKKTRAEIFFGAYFDTRG